MIHPIPDGDLANAINGWFGSPEDKDNIILLHGQMKDWDVYHVKDFSSAFKDKPFAEPADSNEDITNWNLYKPENMSHMFYNCTNFNQNIGDTNCSWPNKVSSVTDMSSMFKNCTKFNQDLSNWNVSKVTNMSYMFYECNNFNKNLYSWNVAKVTDMSFMFTNCTHFNADISLWNVSNVMNMTGMFANCIAFSMDISTWVVSNVTNMSKMFYRSNRSSFNQDLSEWDVSSVIDMSYMFHNCTQFNQNLSNWNISNVTDMSYMFFSCVFNKHKYYGTGKEKVWTYNSNVTVDKMYNNNPIPLPLNVGGTLLITSDGTPTLAFLHPKHSELHDTDGDGFSDYTEIIIGSNPNSSDSKPADYNVHVPSVDSIKNQIHQILYNLYPHNPPIENNITIKLTTDKNTSTIIYTIRIKGYDVGDIDYGDKQQITTALDDLFPNDTMSVNFKQGSIIIESTHSFDNPICFLKGTKVLIDNVGYKNIEDIQSGEYIFNNRVAGIVKTNHKGKIVKISKGAIAFNVPFVDTFVTHSHILFVNGISYKANQLINNKSITEIEVDSEIFNVLLEDMKYGKMKVNNMIAETLHPLNKKALKHFMKHIVRQKSIYKNKRSFKSLRDKMYSLRFRN